MITLKIYKKITKNKIIVKKKIINKQIKIH